jgi:hypothetical protein
MAQVQIRGGGPRRARLKLDRRRLERCHRLDGALRRC